MARVLILSRFRLGVVCVIEESVGLGWAGGLNQRRRTKCHIPNHRSPLEVSSRIHLGDGVQDKVLAQHVALGPAGFDRPGYGVGLGWAGGKA